MNNDLRKNTEGYTDPTAAPTLNRKETADIWTYRDGECLIIKCHPGHATILRLHDSNQYGGRVKVADRVDGPRYVDPTFVISGRYHEMDQYVETLDADTFEEVISAVEDALDINLQTSGPNTQDVEAEVEALRADHTMLQRKYDTLRAQHEQLNELHVKAVDRVNKVYFEKMKVVTQLELLQVMVANVLDSFRQKTED